MIAGVLLLVSAATACFADDVSFVASVDKDQVSLGDRVVLTLMVTGAQNPQTPQLPASDGFDVVSGGTSSQYNIVNGSMFASRSFMYVLVPKKAGKFTVGPATVTCDGTDYKTKPIEIEVLAEGQAPAQQGATERGKELDLGDRIFVDLKVDKDEVYLNEQITLMFRLYRADLSLDDLQYNPPVTKNFIEENVGKQRNYREVVDGTVYDIIELKTALFPAATGEIEITPATLKCSILVRSQRRRPKRQSPFGDMFGDSFFDDPFFDRYVKYPVELSTKPIKVKVSPLPEDGKPATFAGAVGKYEMEVAVKPARVKAGEPVTMTMKVIGRGNIASLPQPAIPNLAGFKEYEPESKVNVMDRTDTVYGEKVFEKVLVPEKAGLTEVPAAVFSYFDPETRAYRTITKGPFPIEVIPAPPGSVIQNFDGAEPAQGKKEVKILKQDILFIKPSPGRVFSVGSRLVDNPLFMLAQLVPFLIFVGTYATLRRRERFRTDIGFARKTQAYRRAMAGLGEAIQFASSGQEKELYGRASRALGGYVADKLNVPAGGMTAQTMKDLMAAKGIDAGLVAETEKILEECDMGQFAMTKRDAQAMKQFVNEIEGTVKKLEKVLR